MLNNPLSKTLQYLFIMVIALVLIGTVSAALTCSVPSVRKTAPNFLSNPGFEIPPPFTCMRKQACLPTEFKILGISGLHSMTGMDGVQSIFNAHAENYSQSNYTESICCSRRAGLYTNHFIINNDPTLEYDVVDIFSLENAHGSATIVNLTDIVGNTAVPIKVEVYPEVGKKIVCDTIFDDSQSGNNACAVNGYTTCIIELSSETNAHFADCSFGWYPYKVCCGLDNR